MKRLALFFFLTACGQNEVPTPETSEQQQQEAAVPEAAKTQAQDVTPPAEADEPTAVKPEELPPATPESPPVIAPASRKLQCKATCSAPTAYTNYAWEESFELAATGKKFVGGKTWSWEAPAGLMVFSMQIDVEMRRTTFNGDLLHGDFELTTDQRASSSHAACFDGCDAALIFDPPLETEFGPITNFELDCESVSNEP